MTTTIRVRRPDGTIEEIVKPGTIIEAATRRKFEDATRSAGRGEIIGWQVNGARTAPAQTQRTASHGLYRRDQARCKGCGRIGDDGECGFGTY